MNLKRVGNLVNNGDLVATIDIYDNTYLINTIYNSSEKQTMDSLEDATKGESEAAQSLSKKGTVANFKDDPPAEIKYTGILKVLLQKEDNNIIAQKRRRKTTLELALEKNNLEISSVVINAEVNPGSTTETTPEILADFAAEIPKKATNEASRDAVVNVDAITEDLATAFCPKKTLGSVHELVKTQLIKTQYEIRNNAPIDF